MSLAKKRESDRLTQVRALPLEQLDKVYQVFGAIREPGCEQGLEVEGWYRFRV
jgi:hypothetical protein